jgi:hypothetical protein
MFASAPDYIHKTVSRDSYDELGAYKLSLSSSSVSFLPTLIVSTAHTGPDVLTRTFF